MITNRTADYIRAHIEQETEGQKIVRRDMAAIPGAILAQFKSLHDAMLFRGIKGPMTHCVTAGVDEPYAVRQLVML